MKKIILILVMGMVLLGGCMQTTDEEIRKQKQLLTIDTWEEPEAELLTNQYCEKLKTTKKQCYYELAKWTGKIGFCKTLTDDYLKEILSDWALKLYRLKCYAVATKDKNYCGMMIQMDEKETSDYCNFYVEQAINQVSKKDFDDCPGGGTDFSYICRIGKILLLNLEPPKNELYEAILNGDESYCESVSDKTYLDQYRACIIGLALRKELKEE